MGIQFLKYISHILQVSALILWTGSLLMNVLILFPVYKKAKGSYNRLSDFVFEAIHNFQYIYLFAIIFLWSGILIQITSAFSNPLQSKIYILYLFLSGLVTFSSVLKVFWIQRTIVKSERALRLFPKDEIKQSVGSKIEKYLETYFYISTLNLLIITVIILLNQY